MCHQEGTWTAVELKKKKGLQRYTLQNFAFLWVGGKSDLK